MKIHLRWFSLLQHTQEWEFFPHQLEVGILEKIQYEKRCPLILVCQGRNKWSLYRQYHFIAVYTCLMYVFIYLYSSRCSSLLSDLLVIIQSCRKYAWFYK